MFARASADYCFSYLAVLKGALCGCRGVGGKHEEMELLLG